jgi:hypothetical protein
VHIGIADDNGKDKAPDEFENGILSDFRPQHGGDVRVAVKLVLVVGEFPEDLREILHVNGCAVRKAIEPLHGEGLACDRTGLFGQAFNGVDIDELVFRHGDADTYDAI